MHTYEQLHNIPVVGVAPFMYVLFLLTRAHTHTSHTDTNSDIDQHHSQRLCASVGERKRMCVREGVQIRAHISTPHPQPI